MKYMNNHYGVGRVFKGARCKLPMNLQYFAEGGEGGDDPGAGGAGGAGGTGGTDPGDGGNDPQPVSFDDFLKDPKNQSEFDKRVAKALETNRTKMQAEIEAKMAEAKTEAEKMAKMNAEQKAQYEAEKREADIAKREADITRRELMAAAKEQLQEKGIPLSLASVLNYANAEECTKSIEEVGKAFQEAVEQAVEARIAGGKPPKKPGGQATYTMDQIRAMSPAEINANWEAVQASMKNGN